MKLAHLADLHVGFAQYKDAMTASGQNQREADVIGTFTRAIDAVIALAPDVVVVAGDVFHRPNPAPTATVAVVDGFARLVRALPNAPVVVVSGNHDLSGDLSARCILAALEPLGVFVVEREAARIYLPALDLSILGVPDARTINRPVLAPDPRASTNVLVLHGEVQGMLPAWMARLAALEISNEELAAALWTYVALGHYHLHTQLAPNVAYSGSIDYTSSNTWEEIGTPKGFVVVDLTTGESTFHVLEPSRVFVDLPAFDAHGLSAREIDARIAAAVDAVPGGIDGKVVRLVITEVGVLTRQSLDQAMIARYRARALHLNLDARLPGDTVGTFTAAEQLVIDAELRALRGEDDLASGEDGSSEAIAALVQSLVTEQLAAQSTGAFDAKLREAERAYGFAPTPTRAEILADIAANRIVREWTAEDQAWLVARDRAIAEAGPLPADFYEKMVMRWIAAGKQRPAAAAVTVTAVDGTIAPTKAKKQRGAA